jgi:hypothetical protein
MTCATAPIRLVQTGLALMCGGYRELLHQVRRRK